LPCSSKFQRIAGDVRRSRSFAASAPGLTFAGGVIDAVDLGSNLASGNYVDVTVNGIGVGGAAVTLFGSPTNPVGVGLTTFRVSYGLTYSALELLETLPYSEVAPGEDPPSAPNPGGEGAGPTPVDPLPASPLWNAGGIGGSY
jgi:hypothetical protein